MTARRSTLLVGAQLAPIDEADEAAALLQLPPPAELGLEPMQWALACHLDADVFGFQVLILILLILILILILLKLIFIHILLILILIRYTYTT